MTEPTSYDTQSNDSVDTTDGDRDQLTTDDGLAEVAEAGVPEVEQRGVTPGEDSTPEGQRQQVDAPGLQVDEDGTDPTADDPAPQY